MSGQNKLLTGLSGKKFATRQQAAPGDRLVSAPTAAQDGAPMGATRTVNGQTQQKIETTGMLGADGSGQGYTPVNQGAAPESKVHNFMRNTFGNGGGAQSRADAISDAKNGIAQGLGLSRDEVDQTFQGYTAPDIGDAQDIRWTPAKAQAEPDKINTLEEAQIELDNAIATGSPEHIEVANRRVNSIIQAGKIKAEQAAAAQGLSAEGTYVNVFGDPGPDGKPVWKGTVKVEKNPDGQLVEIGTNNVVDPARAKTMDKREWAWRDDLTKSAGKEIQDYRTALDNQVGLIAGVGALDKIYQENPAALQKYSSAAAKIIQDVSFEVGAGVNLLARDTDKEYSQEFAVDALKKQADILQQRLNSDDNPITRQANANALAETQKALLTYRLAATLGQTGRNLAETERKMIAQGFDASNYKQFRMKAASLLKQSNQTIERQAESVKALTKDFKDTYNYVPYNLQVETPKERLMNVTEKTDPDLYAGRAILDGRPTDIDPDAPKPLEQPKQAPKPLAPAPTDANGQPVQLVPGKTVVNGLVYQGGDPSKRESWSAPQ